VGNKTDTDKNNNNKAQVTYKGNETGTDKNNDNKAQGTDKGNKTGTDKNNWALLFLFLSVPVLLPL
jgi:hypothetical protein